MKIIERYLRDRQRTKQYKIKRCPFCSYQLPLEATVCSSCKSKVGQVDKHGMASKPTRWAANIVCLISWAVFGWYIWWAFLKD
ncbi:MAG: hypothetical protein QNI95_06425 [Desulfobacterales bacterium]|nr:hypothetical protein [Desulfobacterales bacterium]